ncbi:MAG: carboxypeptidase-like regulatory domain-containing protein [Flavobacteriales bacterium]|nr:carboxypeptidase-like regulatory domain-containing protein [Flavobacteriales bacterium]
MSRKIYLLFLLALLVSTGAMAQVSAGTLKGKVTDAETGEPLPFVNVVVFLNGNQITGTNTDFDGEYTIKPIDAGTYEVLFSYVGYNTKKITGVKVVSNKIQFANAQLASGVALEEVEVVEYTVPLIDRDGGASGGTVTRDDIDKMPGRDAVSLATTVAGVSTAGTGGGVSIRGSRPDGTWIYIDGIKIRGSSSLPKSAIQEVSVLTGGIPANIGDATGGVMNISLRNSSAKWFGGFEVITSGFKSGETAVGLDRYGYNLVEGVISGPLLFAKDEEGNKERPLLGLFLSGNYTSILDPRPAYGGVVRMTEDARAQILNNPLRQNLSSSGEVNGALYNADFLSADDFETVDTRLNVGSRSANLVAKVDVNTSQTMTLTFGGTAAYNRNAEFSRARSLMNHENNVDETNFDWRVYGKFSQRFVNEEEDEGTASNLKNIFYTVMVDYSRSLDRRQDENHEDNFFRYGHVGQFEVFDRNAYQFQGDRYVHVGWEDTLVTFAPSQYNPELAAINNQYFGLFDDEPYNIFDPGPYSSLLEVQNGNALLNGQVAPATYGLWSYYGTQANEYFIQNNSQFRVTAAGSADIGDHAVQIGFEYEQRSDAFYSLSPVGLWTLARLYTNSHIQEIDQSDSTVTNIGTDFYVTYDRLIGDGQFQFDRNLRIALGLDPNGNDFVNVDALDPETFSIDMFGADDLLNQGNNVVLYSGYDHHGNKLNGRPTIEDFFNETNDQGFRTRPIGAYEPIYIAGYVMDKFTFDDIIFNVGLRVDRFDANQPVLKDPYVIGQAFTVGDIRTDLINDLEEGIEIPTNISDDYVVYVDDLDNPTTIVGYRDGDTWFNAQGSEITDPDAIASTNGFPAPWLINGPDEDLNSGAFKDYEPQVNIMPRIAFSFNISDEAVFFAHYDILTQRPTSSNRFSPIDYLFIEARNALISNPDLRPTKTIDYELGFQQVLSRTSSLKISAFYRELRDMIQVRQFAGAYPRPYRAFGNLDFGTTKGLTIAYDLRRTGNVRLNTSYTLQFADGTGSTTTTALALINAGLPNLRTIAPFNYDQRHRIVANLDYRYGGGKDYNGPVWFGKQVFANTGINFIANLGSGTPYTASTIAVPITGEVSPSTEGSINGSRLPWQFNLDVNIDKNFTLTFGGEGDKAKTANLNVYLWILNALNTQNINSVYRFTGVHDDDGYLAAAQYQPQINSQNDPASFRNYYNMFVNNPFNLGLPRQIRLGVKLDF